MAKGGFVIHVKEETELRELVALVRGSLANGYRKVVSQIGVTSHQVWMARTKQGPALMVTLEAADPEAAVRAFIQIEDPPIGIWLREAAMNTTELDQALERPMELLLDHEQEAASDLEPSPTTLSSTESV